MSNNTDKSSLLQPLFGAEIPTTIAIKLFDDNGVIPTRAHDSDVGFDLYTLPGPDIWVEPQQFVDLPTGIGIEFPSDMWFKIEPRSSTLGRYGLVVNATVIDPGYRGPLFVGVYNVGKRPVQIKGLTRLAQIVPHMVIARQWDIKLVKELSQSDRGEKGRGSSGK